MVGNILSVWPGGQYIVYFLCVWSPPLFVGLIIIGQNSQTSIHSFDLCRNLVTSCSLVLVTFQLPHYTLLLALTLKMFQFLPSWDPIRVLHSSYWSLPSITCSISTVEHLYLKWNGSIFLYFKSIGFNPEFALHKVIWCVYML